MLFNSFEFAIFLPIVFLLYWFVLNRNLRLQNAFVIVASYVFYGWWNWRFLILIVFTSLCSWTSGLLIQKFRSEHWKAKFVSITNIVVNLLILGVFKYYNFFVQSFADVFLDGNADGLLLDLILPVGISFYTFQALSYSIDVYKGKIGPTRDIISFFAFISFFPQLVAGPIERATNLLPQFQRVRNFDYASAVDGCRQILWGLFKKVVVADNCAEIVNQTFTDFANSSGSELVLGALLFTFQIYGDFSGYSDIAIGTAKLFGVRLMQNFRVPYFSRDIAEFWRRWHISLTTWFRDYVYIPLGGSRCSKLKVVRNTFVIFLVSGLWHGANWTFVVWGTYHALLFLPLIILGRNRKYTDTVAEGRFLPNLKETLQMFLTFMLVVIGWVVFRAENIADAASILTNIFSRSLFTIPGISIPSYIYFILLGENILEWFSRNNHHPLELLDLCKHRAFRYGIYLLFVFLIFFYTAKPQPFVYFQF